MIMIKIVIIYIYIKKYNNLKKNIACHDCIIILLSFNSLVPDVA